MRPQNSVMLPPFDIFRVETDGHLVWKDTAETLVLARLRVKILMVSQPGDFVITAKRRGTRPSLNPMVRLLDLLEKSRSASSSKRMLGIEALLQKNNCIYSAEKRLGGIVL